MGTLQVLRSVASRKLPQAQAYLSHHVYEYGAVSLLCTQHNTYMMHGACMCTSDLCICNYMYMTYM